MNSFRVQIIVFGLLVVFGSSYLILKGMWPLDKAGQTTTGMNLPENTEISTDEPPERSRDMFHHYERPAPMPQISFFAAENQPVDFSRWRGQKLVVNIWATWCAPCVDELPYLDVLKEKSAALGMDVIAVSIDRQKDQAQIAKFLDKLGVKNLTPYHDVAGEFMRKLDIGQFPLTLILNEQGEIIAQHQGPLKWDEPRVIKALSNL
jgi:thiol-disulfide isomerase/thioredoxin